MRHPRSVPRPLLPRHPMNCAADNATHYADCLISSSSTARKINRPAIMIKNKESHRHQQPRSLYARDTGHNENPLINTLTKNVDTFRKFLKSLLKILRCLRNVLREMRPTRGEAINLLHLVRKFELFRVEANVFLFSLKNKRFLKIEGSHFRLRHFLHLLLPQAMSINRYCPSPSFLRSVPRWRSHSRAKRSDIQSRGIVYSWPAPRT